MRKGVVLAATIYGGLFGLGIALATPNVYTAKVTIMVCCTDPSCGTWHINSFLRTPPTPAASSSAILLPFAQTVDRLAARLGYTNIAAEQTLTNLLRR
jgi:hypothetical protein